MKKLLLGFSLFLLLWTLSATPALAQNKAGINIGANHDQFDQAAEVVGNGGWIVMMACPGDADKIAEAIVRNPNINLIIRGHFWPNKPDSNLAKAWAATLASLPTPNKIYFVPWNEPNEATDYAEPSQLVNYISVLVEAFNPIRSKVVLLSPMFNQSNGNFTSYVSQVKGLDPNFFQHFDGIAMNLYDFGYDDNCGGVLCSPSKYRNPALFAQIIAEDYGVPGKPAFGIESGTAGNNFYFQTEPTANSPLYRFTEKFLNEVPVKMFAIPSYNLGDQSDIWSLFSTDAVTGLLSRSSKGGATPAGSASHPSGVKLCPGKKYVYYIQDESECGECGGESSLTYCKPIKASNFGEEYSPSPIPVTEKIRYYSSDNSCVQKDFTGSTEVSSLQIPFARQLNQYFLGTLSESAKAPIEQQSQKFLQSQGVFQKLAPAELQNQLKLKFLAEIQQRGSQSRYKNYRINGLNAQRIADTYRANPNDPKFLKEVWAFVPLFANEESEGEIVFEGGGVNGVVKTSVPEVYRLNQVTTLIAQMLGVYQPVSPDSYTPSPAPPGSCETPQTQSLAEKNLETKTGLGMSVCTSEEIQSQGENNLIGYAGVAKSDVPPDSVCPDAGEDCREYITPEGCMTDDGLLGKRTCYRSGHCTCSGGAECCSLESSVSCDLGCSANYSQPSNLKTGYRTETITTNINVKNRVPYLRQIAENTIGPKGFFRIFIPWLQQEKALTASQKEIDYQFREVAGESKANLEISFTTPTGLTLTAQKPSPLTLLFHKLGTIINVRNFISSRLLCPYKLGCGTYDSGNAGQVQNDGEEVTLDYTIDFRNSNIPITADMNEIAEMVKNTWPNSKISSRWLYVRDQALAHGWNPAFVVALWIEESGASGTDAYDLGCLAAQANNIDSGLDCLFHKAVKSDQDFATFMCSYSENQPAPCKFIENKNFPGNLKFWYDELTK